MHRTAVSSLIVALSSVSLLAQQPASPPMYTYVSEWVYPRAQWSNVGAQFDKQVRGILERRMADGSIVEWGRAMPLVHTENGPTHSTWYVSPTLTGIYRVLDDVAKLPRDESLLPSKHSDQLLRSAVYHSSKDVPRRSAIMMTSYVSVAPGKGREWRALWDKNTEPVYQKAMKEGTILGYGLDLERVHTGSMYGRYEWVMLPDIQAADKLEQAFGANAQSRSAEENRAFATSMRETTDSASHRDQLWLVMDWAHK